MPVELDNPFWQFSLKVYAAPGVASECLALQDELGVDVNVILFAAWAGLFGISIRADDLIRIRDVAGSWTHDVVKPLRQVRRYLKPLCAGDTLGQELRKRVADAELSAEQIEQARLFSISSTLGAAASPSGIVTAQANVAIILASYGRSSDVVSPLRHFWDACAAVGQPQR
jgi:uncharacterized protein (TIGR02444 family)